MAAHRTAHFESKFDSFAPFHVERPSLPVRTLDFTKGSSMTEGFHLRSPGQFTSLQVFHVERAN